MTKMPYVINRTVTSLTATELMGATSIGRGIFGTMDSLIEIQIPSTVTHIGAVAFFECKNLKKVDFQNGHSLTSIDGMSFMNCNNLVSITGLDTLNPYCVIGGNSLEDTPYVTNQKTSGAPDFGYAALGKILLFNNDLTGNFTIPSTVVNLGPASCGYTTEDTTTTRLIIPDTVEIVNDYAFSNRTALATITIGSAVRYIGVEVFTYCGEGGVLIFRQPAGMYIEVPTEGNGMAYNKNSREMTIYTDNECIRNYDWAKDNVTATIYPLSDAPA